MARFDDLLSRKTSETTIAVVGASTDPRKFGYRITLDLKKHGYTVWPVNPRAQEIAGLTVYPSLAELPHLPDLVDVVTPAPITAGVIEGCVQAGIKRIWLQPGSFNSQVLELARGSDLEVEAERCIMVAARWL